ncbi:MAG TPA: aspartate 1-decarboxylase [Candidatus Omnitrophota bacterium]|nr:aspartate 1-decarboxylase [Candidatus Omnitrophota bacterium]HPD84220.1 aspartate 1-decarboxylase [Candidatus Omnitrophota bacterium]HRZ03076.1 aspartate 1-decarboxylase [Candidatus Omnitrophota bacterium]
MLITICKSKITNATITQTELYYQGSITVDEKLLKAVNIIPGEKVEVLNINNGARIETYTIAGKAGSGQVCLNGPAARSGCVGDKLIILSYCLAEPKEASTYTMKVISLDDSNKIKN